MELGSLTLPGFIFGEIASYLVKLDAFVEFRHGFFFLGMLFTLHGALAAVDV